MTQKAPETHRKGITIFELQRMFPAEAAARDCSKASSGRMA